MTNAEREAAQQLMACASPLTQGFSTGLSLMCTGTITGNAIVQAA
jgi:hypothetical protein